MAVREMLEERGGVGVAACGFVIAPRGMGLRLEAIGTGEVGEGVHADAPQAASASLNATSAALHSRLHLAVSSTPRARPRARNDSVSRWPFTSSSTPALR